MRDDDVGERETPGGGYATDIAGPRTRGRPRAPETDRRILEAAFRLMLQGGYARLSIDQVAEEAGVGRPTIYRRYRGKEDLAIAALAAAQIESLVLPQTGDTRADLITHLRRFAAAAGRPYGMAMIGTVLAEEHETPEILRHFREDVVASRRRVFRALLERADERGELRAGADLDLVVNLLVGAFYAQYLDWKGDRSTIRGPGASSTPCLQASGEPHGVTRGRERMFSQGARSVWFGKGADGQASLPTGERLRQHGPPRGPPYSGRRQTVACGTSSFPGYAGVSLHGRSDAALANPSASRVSTAITAGGASCPMWHQG